MYSAPQYFRYTNTERCKVPNSLNATRYHFICYLLCYINRHSQYPDIHITGFHFYLKFIRMINRNSIYFLPDQSGINIKRTYYL